MRRFFAPLLAVVLLNSFGCTQSRVRPAEPGGSVSHRESSTPKWLPAYGQAERELLALRAVRRVSDKATRIFPELNRFTFSGPSEVSVPSDLTSHSDMIDAVLERSSRVYRFYTNARIPGNTVALFGPEAKPTPSLWTRASSAPKPSFSNELPSFEARLLLEQVAAATPEARIRLLGQAIKQSPETPGLLLCQGDLALRTGDLALAEASARRALELDSRSSQGYRLLAEALLRAGHKESARQAVARSLALYPTYPRAWQLAEAILSRPVRRDPILTMPFIEVTDEGEILVVTDGTSLSEGYAGCKAVFRYEPTVRAHFLGLDENAPYHLSSTEEFVCLQAALGRNYTHRLSEDPKGRDSVVPEELVRIANSQRLMAFGMFEVIGRYRPEWLQLAPRDLHDRIYEYVLEDVLSLTSPAPIPRELVRGLQAKEPSVRQSLHPGHHRCSGSKYPGIPSPLLLLATPAFVDLCGLRPEGLDSVHAGSRLGGPGASTASLAGSLTWTPLTDLVPVRPSELSSRP